MKSMQQFLKMRVIVLAFKRNIKFLRGICRDFLLIIQHLLNIDIRESAILITQSYQLKRFILSFLKIKIFEIILIFLNLDFIS